MAFFSVIILFAVDIFTPKETHFQFYTTAAFIIGAVTSTVSGYLGM
jgi:Na+/H+-translocating membrane pyrophosphatase